MDKTGLVSLPIVELGPMLARRQVSPRELIDNVLDRIEHLNARLNAYVHVDWDGARQSAREAEREITRGDYRGPLHGIPIALKDNVLTAGVPTRAGSRILGNFVPDEDACVVRRLKQAGAILIGKTNLSEFAYGTETNNPRFGRTLNPWDTGRIPGGSSGGSAAATAAIMCSGSIGTDTGGSIRNPAALCGIVGLKPTYGRVSCQGVIPLAPSLDHVGPMARRVLDAAIILGVIAGHDLLDDLSVPIPVPDYVSQAMCERNGIRVGVPREFFFEHLDPDIETAVRAALGVFVRCGALLEEVRLPHVAESETACMYLSYAEATCTHQAAGYFPSRAEEYALDVRGRLEEGERVLATDYLRARAMRKLLRRDFDLALMHVDVILAPTVPIPAPTINQQTVTMNSHTTSTREALIRFNRPSNVTGLPAISVPCGLTKDGLPIAFQLIGRAFEEGSLFQLAHKFESSTTWHLQNPAGV